MSDLTCKTDPHFPTHLGHLPPRSEKQSDLAKSRRQTKREDLEKAAKEFQQNPAILIVMRATLGSQILPRCGMPAMFELRHSRGVVVCARLSHHGASGTRRRSALANV